MKKMLVPFVLLLLLCLIGAAAADASGHDYEYQLLEDGTVQISLYKGKGKNLTIPDTIDGYVVSSIGQAFSNNQQLVSVTIPDTVASIGDKAFSGCKKLKSVTLPDNVTEIGERAFADTALTGKFTVRAGVTYGKAAFSRTKITSVIVEDGVVSIPKELFQGCEKLTSITLSSTVAEVLDSAFHAHRAKKILIPASVKRMERSAFTGAVSCVYDLSENMSLKYQGEYSYFGLGTIIYAIGSTSEKKYEGSSWAKAAPIPKEKTVMPADRVLKRSGFTREDRIYHIVIPEGVEEIEDEAFAELYTLVSVEFPSTLKKIGNYAFGYTHLKEISLPDSVTELGEQCFAGCRYAEKLHLSKGLKEIPSRAFNYLKKLTVLNIPSGITTIGRGAFQDCNGIKQLSLPNTLITIEAGAFASLPLFAEICFYSKDGSTWSSLRTLNIPASVQTIGEGAFSGYDTLTTINFAKNSRLRSIGKEAFNGLFAIKKIDLSGLTQLEQIGNHAFCSCDSLQALTLPPQDMRIGKHIVSATDKLTVYVTKDSAADTWLRPLYQDTIKIKYKK